MKESSVAEGAPNSPLERRYPPASKAWLSTVIVFILTAIAIADRMAISMLIGPIKADFGIGDFQASLLIGLSFTLFYMLFLLPIGIAADRFSRAKVLAICLAVWTVATVLCGFAIGFITLFLARMLMGAGEAGIGPCSHGIIGSSFPRKSLSKPLALQGIGFQVGPAIGVFAAGAILAAGAAGSFEGIPVLGELAPWRIAFILIGAPGFLALLLIPLLHDPDAANRKAQALNAQPSDKAPKQSVIPFLRENRLLISLVMVGSGVSAMASGTVVGWAPEYLQRSLGVSPIEAGAALGPIMLVAAFAGQGLFSFIVDWFAARGVLDAPIRVGLFPIALAIPFAWLAFAMEDAAGFYAMLLGFMLLVAPFNALSNTIIQQIAPPALRSRLSAILIFSISILGFTIAPSLVGWMSEHVFGEAHLGKAMQLVATASLIATFVLFLAAWRPLIRFMNAQEAQD